MIRYILFAISSLVLIVGCKKSIDIDEEDNVLYFDTIVVSDQEYKVYTMLDSMKHGVMKRYRNDYGNVEQYLYLDDSLVLIKQSTFDTIHKGFEYFYHLNDTLYYIGALNYDYKTLKKDQSYCSYFEYTAPDTVKLNESFLITITGNVGSFKNFSTHVAFGRIKKEDFSLSSIDTIYKSTSPEIIIEINEYEEGINLITGIISYYDNINGKDITNVPFLNKHLSNPLVFYHQFVAIQ